MKSIYSVFYLSPAEKDLEAVFDFIRRDSPASAERFLKRVDRSVARLGRFPLTGVVPRDRFLRQKGFRVLVVGNYLVFYRVERKAVWIYRILHGKRRYQFLL
ncbi:MAG: type II toxin-antitoxin system RelE/ParE family toxin [Deltaproteobacteria bacterium]|nr:type II toxin-antitoxin system RelE/ParE family toxin [Deltaproteobacteria bacterium]